MAKPKPVKKLSQMTAGERKVRVAKLIQSPGTRSAVPTEYLPENLRKQREMNTRLNAPVVQGSSVTNRDASRQAQAGADVKYGDAIRQQNTGIGQSEQLAKDQAGWFDDYRRALKDAQGDTQQIGQRTTEQIQSLAGALQAPNTAGFSAENMDDASKAAAVRKAILGNLGAVQTAQAGNANSYANQLANVVAPGQKLAAQAQAAGKTKTLRDELAGLLKEQGSYKEQLKGDIAASESKNVLAQQALGLDVSKAQTQAQLDAARIGETSRHNRASEKQDAASVRERAKADGQKINSYGYTNADWAAMTTEQRRKIIQQGKGSPKGKSPYLGTAGQNTFKRSFDSAKATAEKIKGHYNRNELRGLLKNGRQAQTVFLDSKNQPIPNAVTLADARKVDAAAKPVKVPAISPITDDAILSAVLDTVLDGHLSQYTIKKLHKAGIKVNALGVSTKPPRATKVVDDAISSVGQAISGLG